MERRISKLLNNYIAEMKKEFKKKMEELEIPQDEKMNKLFQFIYDYPPVKIQKNDIAKRTRQKNIVPLCDRCTALRANNEQCTRRRKENQVLCGTHLKGTPHGLIQTDQQIPSHTKITVWPEDINGIINFIDSNHNIYDPMDIHHNSTNPKIIAKWKKRENGDYYIPAAQ